MSHAQKQNQPTSFRFRVDFFAFLFVSFFVVAAVKKRLPSARGTKAREQKRCHGGDGTSQVVSN
jgi:hypothetical protein